MRWPILACVCALASVARAQPAEPQPTVYGALPSGVHVARAETLDRGVAVVQVQSGVGYRSGLLLDDHSFVRALANLAAAFGVTRELSLGLSLDGYYDRHDGFPTGSSSGCGEMCEQGYVGAPRLHGRYVKRVGDIGVGAHLTVWVPGDQVPSVKLGATSVELRGLTSLRAGPGTLSIDAGFRLDNTIKTIDDIESFTVPDRVSYGSSNYNALIAGVHYAVAVSPRLWVAGESSFAWFLGSAPDGTADLEDGRWLARLGASAGITLAPQWTAFAYLDAVKSPGVLSTQSMANDIPLIPYEPMITAGLGVQARFGGSSQPRGTGTLGDGSTPCWETAAGCKAEEQPLTTDLSGTVLDDAGAPIAGATVTVTGKVTGTTATATTNADGTYTVTGVRIGRRTVTPAKAGPTTSDSVEETSLEVRIDAEGREPIVSTIDAPKAGANAIPPVTLQPTLPPGQVKGIVRTQRGQPIAKATLTVTPGGATATTGADGTFAIDLVPGTYRVKVTAPGYSAQELDVTIDPNGVALKEFILSR